MDILFPDLSDGMPAIKEVTRKAVEVKCNVTVPSIAVDLMLKARGITTKKAIADKRNINFMYLGTLFFNEQRATFKEIKKELVEENSRYKVGDPEWLNGREIAKKATELFIAQSNKAAIKHSRIRRQVVYKKKFPFKVIESNG